LNLILEATIQGYNFRFLTILVIGHVTIIPTPHWMDPDKYKQIDLATNEINSGVGMK
jgi:hypothetical protein